MDAPIDGPSSARVGSPEALIQHLPKIWIGYLLAIATALGEGIAYARNPDLAKHVEFGIPPLEIFLPTFVALVYWLVCVHQYHVVLANVPGLKHPISPARAVWFHFIPIYLVYWIFRWPAAIADFVNFRLPEKPLRRWTIGVIILASLVGRALIDPALGVAMMFYACTVISTFLQRALAAPLPNQN